MHCCVCSGPATEAEAAPAPASGSLQETPFKFQPTPREAEEANGDAGNDVEEVVPDASEQLPPLRAGMTVTLAATRADLADVDGRRDSLQPLTTHRGDIPSPGKQEPADSQRTACTVLDDVGGEPPASPARPRAESNTSWRVRPPSDAVKRKLFKCIVLMEIFVNFDSGTVPCLLDVFKVDFGHAKALDLEEGHACERSALVEVQCEACVSGWGDAEKCEACEVAKQYDCSKLTSDFEGTHYAFFEDGACQVYAACDSPGPVDADDLPSDTPGETYSFVGLSFGQLGMLTSLPYWGLTVASPVWGQLLQRKSPRYVVFCGMLLNLGSCAMMAISPDLEKSMPGYGVGLLFLSRLCIGLTQAGFVIYAPVWVDEFAIEGSGAVWMGVIQASAAIGVMVGYGVSGTVAHSLGWQWKWAIWIQVFGLAPFTLGVLLLPQTWVDTGLNEEKEKKQVIDDAAPKPKGPSEDERLVAKAMADEEKQRLAAASPAGSPVSTSKVMFDVSAMGGEGKSEPSPGQAKKRVTVINSSGKSGRSTVGALIAVDFEESDSDDGPRVVTSSLSQRATRALRASSYVAPGNLVQSSTSAISGPESGNNVCRDIADLIFAPMWTSLVLCLCALFFVVTGIQSWATLFFLTAETMAPNPDQATVMLTFTAIAATGPTVGVIVGGIFVESSWIGGYKTAQGKFRSMLMCLFAGTTATVLGIVAGWVPNFPVSAGCMWLLLFFGGGMLPAATGIVVGGVRPELRPFSAALSMALYNVFGYSLGGLLPGLIMDSVGGIVWGMRIILLWAVWGVLACVVAVSLAYREVLTERSWWENAGVQPDTLGDRGAGAAAADDAI